MSETRSHSVSRALRLPSSAALVGPHALLGVVAAVTLVAEAAARESGSSLWMLVAFAVAAVCFVGVWKRQAELALGPLLALALAFQLAWIALHLHLDVTSFDSAELYRGWGNELLDGRYPDSQYPPGAVLLFGLDAWLGGGATRTSHAFVMVPFQLLTVAAIWALRTPFAPWLAALVALWPANAFFSEFRFDPVPTALLACGLVAALRGRWGFSGALLGIGAATKWFPGLTFGFLAVWLLVSGERRPLARHAAAFVASFGLLHVPFLLWSPEEASFAYRYFSDQGLTGESVWYVLLAPLGLARVDLEAFWLPADVGSWADPLAVTIQALALGVLFVCLLRERSRLVPAIALSALAPAVFLLTNRVFSPQYLVTILAVWAIAGALVVDSRRNQLVLGLLAMAATAANAFVYPYTLFQNGLWRLASAALFGVAVGTTVWLVRCAERVPTDRGRVA